MVTLLLQILLIVGQQHYHEHFIFGDPKEQMLRDKQRRQVLEQAGITLIEIPYWWDATMQTFVDRMTVNFLYLFQENLHHLRLAKQYIFSTQNVRMEYLIKLLLIELKEQLKYHLGMLICLHTNTI